MLENPLIKINKLKRFSSFIHENIIQSKDSNGNKIIDEVIKKTNCLYGDDIYTKRDMQEKLDSIANCASIVEVRKYDLEYSIHNANFCHNPAVCPMCADRVSKRRKVIFSDPLKKAVRKFGVEKTSSDWKTEYPEGYTGVYMATATIKAGSNLKERIDTLLDSIKNMRKKGQKREGENRSRGEWAKIRAGLSNVEIKIGSGSNKWHVHAHFLIFTDSPIDIKTKDSPFQISAFGGSKITLSKFNYEWFQASGGEGINFDLKPIQFLKNVHGTECQTFEESVIRQASEVLKYSTVLSEKKGTNILNPFQYIELIQRRGNRRLFNTIGLLRCDKRNPDSLITISDREIQRLEYVESLDKKCYEIFASKWQNGGTYSELSKQEKAIFSNSDNMKTKWINLRQKAFQAQTAIYQGEYRKQRNHLLKSKIFGLNETIEAFETILNEAKDVFRNKVKSLWEKYHDTTYLPDFLTEFTSGGMPEYRELNLSLA